MANSWQLHVQPSFSDFCGLTDVFLLFARDRPSKLGSPLAQASVLCDFFKSIYSLSKKSVS